MKFMIDYKIILKLAIGSLFILLGCIRSLSQIDNTNFIVYVYGYLNDSIGLNNINNILFLIFPQFYFMVILNNHLEFSLDKQAPLIFSRTKYRSKWFIIKILEVILYTAFYSSLIVIIESLFSYLFLKNLSNILIVQLLLIFLHLLFLIILSILFSIKYKSIYCLTFIFSLNVFSYFIINFSKNKLLLLFMPSVHSLLYLHDTIFINRQDELLKFYIQGFYPWWSILYYSILIIISTVIATLLINKKDIM
ncbi:hypothetical protein SAMN05443529_1535 [Desulfosporosinus hippei DSM 8344]|uniref:ABC-2 family transporter protein n=1 Tax=Desulfosporosinus hippei DSM 8344 TaxID=1121419 RepID=A0A1G8LSB8_9FIRM|nr:hypothetical protein SAMN05443529_1535 [Desulfosporosinus hippei DSM 8344]